MFRKRFVCLAAALCMLLSAGAVSAAEVDCDDVYCFAPEDFGEFLSGICITDLPSSGALMLGSRVLQPGDILAADQLAQVTFHPVATREDVTASMTYLPIYENHVDESATMTLGIRGKEDKAPVAEDSAMETYKNIPNGAALKVSDPEGHTLTYTVVRQPRRGTVEIGADGSFTYTPKKNKVGVDSFTYTAADPAGNVSREATVTVRILKPTEAAQYHDMADSDSRFEAEWLRNTGIFTGETLGSQQCFQPEKTVTQGQFLAMVTQLLEIPVDAQHAQLAEEAPIWLKPYLTAALRSGLLAGWPEAQPFSPEAPVTGAQAAVILQNALDLPVSMETVELEAAEAPTWEEMALHAMAENGLELTADQTLSRAETAKLLYQVNTLAQNAPGMYAIRAAQQ